ncbi:cellulase family glycosylhydrolase [Sinomicrobium sp. FJxs]|uniref:Cellulase family glycosylhydrolase n=2 Tax=Sinomicrobium weinanense TaxID=2842200 RepID=A0A926Q1L6_9FLAO|nr:cellulase family glycosylhydrolase [Sinomicrobium weinanense]
MGQISDIFLIVLFCTMNAYGQKVPGALRYTYFEPGEGRQFVPRGFVMNTEDLLGRIAYTEKDYLRAARMGANFQVIRLDMARLGAWPGYSLDSTYLKELDRMVALGKAFGIYTGFKLTVYRVRKSNEKEIWGRLWLNKGNTQDVVIQGWQRLWKRYRDEPYVYSYDLLNEPHKGNTEGSYDEVQRKYLMPLYRRMIDSLRKIDTTKWALYQPMLMEKNPDRAKRKIPFWEMKEDIRRPKIMFAPHIYQLDLSAIKPTIGRYKNEAALSDAPLFLGEWGSATYDETDRDISEQQRYENAYMETARITDSLGMGMIKAWFLGSRWKGTNHMGKFTWAVFQDSVAVGTAERKYITDIIARPFPSKIAGRLTHFKYRFAKRHLKINFSYEKAKGDTEVFVGANRHFPDGFRLSVNNGEWDFVYDPLQGDRFFITEPKDEGSYPDILWDDRLQKIVIKSLPRDRTDYTLDLYPGVSQ